MSAVTDTARGGLTPKSLFRIVAIAEACTWTLLITALILRGTGIANIVFIAGLTHGIVVVSYAVTSLLVALNQRWTPLPTALAIVSTVIPFATIPVDVWLHRTGRLDGPWRTQHSDDPRDAHPIDRAFRWLIRHPLLAAVILVVAVAGIVITLLWLGPPTQWGR